MGKKLPRSAGILMHPTSIYTRYGVGDLGPNAYRLIDLISDSGLRFWQVLPLGPTGFGDSPYQTLSAFALNPLLISPDKLIETGLITNQDIEKIYSDFDWFLKSNEVGDSIKTGEKNIPSLKVNYDLARKYKYNLLWKAYDTFRNRRDEFGELDGRYAEFKNKYKYWLDDFALFYTLKKDNQMRSWLEWPKNYKNRNENALKVYEAMKKKDVEFYKFIQFIAQTQWDALKAYANEKGIEIIGDMPIFVAHDSADVWVNRKYFTVKPDGTLEYQAGVPPDYFSKTGQLWGNPLYRWDVLKEDGYSWFISRMERMLELFDWIRIDHFRGFESYWCVKGDAENAIEGEWIKSPGKELFTMLKERLGDLAIIAEDLGIITPEVEKLRDDLGFPGMRVLQFAFSNDPKNIHLPHNFVRNCVAYTGTHDNNTLKGWWDNELNEELRKQAADYLSIEPDRLNYGFIRELFKSIANLVMVPMQDILEQGPEARMNTPSVPQGNWQYMVSVDYFDENKRKTVRYLCQLFGRL